MAGIAGSRSLVLTPASCRSLLHRKSYGRKNVNSRRTVAVARNVCGFEYKLHCVRDHESREGGNDVGWNNVCF
jgi:hypothetical protein